MVHHAIHHGPMTAAVETCDVFFIENVGNLVCPAIYDLGQAANVVVFAAAVFANLAFEELGADLDVVAVIAVIAAVVWWRRRRDAIVVYYLLAYWLGLGSTLAVQVLA